jgi:hypothetical protein
MASTDSIPPLINCPMHYTRHLNEKSPLARGSSTRRQSNQRIALMGIVCIVASGFITTRDRAAMHLAFAELTLSEKPFQFWSRPETREEAQHFNSSSICLLTDVFLMPRLRGKSRRGAAWYRAESRRKRLQNFEKALGLATIRRKRRSRTTTAKIVEQTRLAEDTHHPPPMAAEVEHATLAKHSAAHLDFPPHCIIEEEIPPGATTGTERDQATSNCPKDGQKSEAEGSTGKRKHHEEEE